MADKNPLPQLPATGRPDGAPSETAVTDYTESVAPATARRSNFRMSTLELDACMGLSTSKISTYARSAPKQITGGPVSLALGLRSGNRGNARRPS